MKYFFLQIKKIINYTSRATLLQKKYSSEAEVTPISGIIDYYFIIITTLLLPYYYIIITLKLGKNKNKLRTIYHFTDSCQEKSVNFKKLFIYPSFGKFWGLFPLLVLSFCQSAKLLAEVVTFSYS